MTGVFDGLRVLDLSSGPAGAMTTMLLADNAASVTRITTSDNAARPSTIGDRVWNRGKRSALWTCAPIATETRSSPSPPAQT
jgi:crotonobetainyl-CoA:carnitine CoA-transferase CaiB-like acyl-CoA transferase